MIGSRREILARKFLLWIALLLGACFAGLPVLWMVASSFKSNLEIFAYPPALIDHSFSFAAYEAVLSDPGQLRFFFNSYLVAILVTICTVITSILAGYSLSRYNFRFKRSLTLVIIGVQSVPPITLMIPYFGLIVWLRIYNTYTALVLTYMVFTLSYAIIMMTGYFNTLPRDLDEAVMIDGGGSFVTLWRILGADFAARGLWRLASIPLCWPGTSFSSRSRLTRTNDMRTVPIGIHLLMGQHSFEWNQMLALSVLGSLPVLILFLLFQRYFIAGMSAGSIKG